ncbi:hypothetical protein BCR36DRAFT_372713 [Piromyces finnis]|uniref:TFIIS N-terminal domain-containing protein n=1 Tax=Piromyces finnis TaxID=1754191 RepID=A0A1Y1V1T7_9FUNG|nr:hypothetical protein BCR36DRAFT_372713 [Piromyces finnis]|eukprot:ORX45353.1 hypothetical protein BCR36DRAFT_372713 [Piromyces finnis]
MSDNEEDIQNTNKDYDEDDLFGGNVEDDYKLDLSDDEDEKTQSRVRRRDDYDDDKPSKRKREDDSDDERPLNPDSKEARIEEARKDFEAALSALKPHRTKKYDGMDAEVDEMISRIREKMEDAAIQDIQFNSNKQPAIAKLRLLPSVISQLEKSHLHEQFLQNDILKGMKAWLEPLPDGSLPSLDIQKAMFNMLDKMPVSTQDLTVSGIGRVLPFYSKCSRVIPEIKRAADNLITKWSRPILNRSDNYRTKQFNTVDYIPNENKSTQKQHVSLTSVNSLDVLKQKPESDDNRYRARIPQAVASNYQVAPRATILNVEKRKPSERMKRLKGRFQKKSGSRPGSKVSIDGKRTI